MKIITPVETKESTPVLEVGDIVKASDTLYMVGKSSPYESSDYLLRELGSGFYANGEYRTLEALTESLLSDWEIYRKKDYDLVLTKKVDY